MAVKNAILYAVKKTPKNRGDMDPSGMEKRDDVGVRDQVDDLISSTVGPEHISSVRQLFVMKIRGDFFLIVYLSPTNRRPEAKNRRQESLLEIAT